LAAIATELGRLGISSRCTPIPVHEIDLSLVERVHSRAYIDRLRDACGRGLAYIDAPDSAICPVSFDIARLAAGTAVTAVDAVINRTVRNAFCAIRPPGHHVEHNRSMGFCLFNNVAVAARRLLDDHGLSRVLILDWDVHHGNATQHMFESDPRVYFISLHGHPGVTYPGTGYAHERGIGAGEGFTLNIPMPPHAVDADYRRAFAELVLPEASAFRPEFVLVSAGFDAHRDDPLGPIDLDTSSFGWMTDAIVDLADRFCEGRLVSLLEGGYDLNALAQSAALHAARLLGDKGVR
jgi:acetoin utilization deacetylase AcuC-like enzyme